MAPVREINQNYFHNFIALLKTPIDVIYLMTLSDEE